jgi:hypothetical protein
MKFWIESGRNLHRREIKLAGRLPDLARDMTVCWLRPSSCAHCADERRGVFMGMAFLSGWFARGWWMRSFGNAKRGARLCATDWNTWIFEAMGDLEENDPT